MTFGSAKAIIFDLDDTLISESSYQKSAIGAVVAHLDERYDVGIDFIWRAIEKASVVPRSEFFQTLLPLLGLPADEDSVSGLVGVHRRHLPEIDWHSDVLAGLSELRNAGFLLGMITDGHAVTQRQKLKALGAEALFEVVVVTDELGRLYWKPHRRAFDIVCCRLGVSADQVVYVGDNPEKDFYISSTLPISTLEMRRPGSRTASSEYFGGVRPDAVVGSMDDLVALLVG